MTSCLAINNGQSMGVVDPDCNRLVYTNFYSVLQKFNHQNSEGYKLRSFSSTIIISDFKSITIDHDSFRSLTIVDRL